MPTPLRVLHSLQPLALTSHCHTVLEPTHRCVHLGLPLHRYDDLKSAQENIDLQSTILSRFDLIFIVKDPASREMDLKIARHVLDNHRMAGARSVGVAARCPASSSCVGVAARRMRHPVSRVCELVCTRTRVIR